MWARDHRPNLTTLEKFPEVFAERLHEGQDALLPSFDVDAALASYGAAVQQLTPRESACASLSRLADNPSRPNPAEIDVAAEAGVYVPTLCYLKDHPALGTCRACVVHVDGRVVPACTVTVSDGMRVEVNEPETTDMRQALVEMLFAEGNHNCPSCEKSGRCTLQAVAYEVDMLASRFPYQYPARVQDQAVVFAAIAAVVGGVGSVTGH